MYFSEDIQWLEPFFAEVYYMFPNSWMLKSVKSLKPRSDKTQQAQAIMSAKGKERKITIFSHRKYHKDGKDKYRKYSKQEVLAFFAHELTHLIYWKHNTKRWTLECMIMIIFSDILNENGYLSEEDEFIG